jgi:L-alanine-DL-glutamate epimerase-like enolase superfamily enzyme
MTHAYSHIVAIEWAWLKGRRPRSAGCNARLGVHGDSIRIPIVRLTTDEGNTGFGASWAGHEQASSLLGAMLDDTFSFQSGVNERWRAFEYPLWDLISKRAGQPVYALAAQVVGRPVPVTLRAPCYDTSLYIDDLHLASTEDAAQLIAGEARTGYAQGHRAFKLKVGRGARHMPLLEGTARDIAVIRAVRDAVGTTATLMIDANNGYNLNLAKQVLQETRDCHVFWLEEPFHEDPVLYQDLKNWLAQQALDTLIADGEGEASANLLPWSKENLIDVIQYDIFGYGFTRWLHTGRQLDAWGVRSAPHHYGGHYGNYAACHLASAIERFTFVEWDDASTPGLDASGYRIEEGHVLVPNQPGFGLGLDDSIFRRAVEQGGGTLWR